MASPLVFHENPAERWRTFEKQWNNCKTGALKTNSKTEKAAKLLNYAGTKALEKAETLSYKPDIKNEAGDITHVAESPDDPDILIKTFIEKFAFTPPTSSWWGIHSSA